MENRNTSRLIHDGTQNLDPANATAFSHTGMVQETELHNRISSSTLIENSEPVNSIFIDSIAQIGSQVDEAEEGATGVNPLSDTVQGAAISSQSVNDGPTTTHLFVRVHRERHVSCDPRCPCVCHRERKGRTPDFLSSLIGRLFVGYSGTPIGSVRCSVRSCKNSVAFGAKVTYIFPQWFVGKSMSLLLWKTQQAELSMLLTVRNYSPDEKIFQHLMIKDWTKVQLLIRHDRVSPNDLETAYGQTLMHVSLLFFGLINSFRVETYGSLLLLESS